MRCPDRSVMEVLDILGGSRLNPTPLRIPTDNRSAHIDPTALWETIPR
jgi:hypothetical protein